MEVRKTEKALLLSLMASAMGLALGIVLSIGLGFAGVPLFAHAAPPASANSSPPGASAANVKQLGSIREIHGSGLLLVTDKGEEISVQVQPGARSSASRLAKPT